MQDINLYQLLRFYVKKWKWIALLTIIGALAGFVYNSYIQVPLYKSDATLLLVKQDAAGAAQDTTLINNYIQLLKSRRVLEPVITKQNNEISYEQLSASVTATNEKNTEVIKLSISTDNAKMSKELVDGTIISFKNEVKEIYDLDNIRIVDSASISIQPFNVNKPLFIALPTAVGLFLSVITLFFIYDFNRGRNAKEAKAKEVKEKPISSKSIESNVVTKKKQTNVKDAVGLLIGAELKKATVKKKSKKTKSSKKK